MILILLFLILTFLILTQSGITLYYAMHGLTLWYSKMVPILLPFMILSGILIKSGKASFLSKLFKPILRPLFPCNSNLYYGIFMGFLCGFPMGAKVSIELLEEKQINTKEASYLLSFCNNIGPVYVLTFLLPLLKIKPSLYILFGIFGIPFLYGLLLNKTYYKDINNIQTTDYQIIHKANNPSQTILDTINASIYNSLQSIIMLCGYMVLCNLLMIIPHILIPNLKDYVWPLIELNGGLVAISNTSPYYSLLCLIFGGLCCFLQTYSIIKDHNLSIKTYFLHKANQTLLAGMYFLYLVKINIAQ